MSNSKNRFWAASSSEYDSDENDSYSDSTQEEVSKKPTEKSKYVVVSESDSEEEKRVVRSPKWELGVE